MGGGGKLRKRKTLEHVMIFKNPKKSYFGEVSTTGEKLMGDQGEILFLYLY